MQEPTYRRNQDGTMVEIVPEARGKAAAISRLLAQGGTPFEKSKRYKKGRFKGLTVDEATARAEALWETSPDSLKQRYADRTSGRMTDLAPSEREKLMTATPAPPKVSNASLNAALPGETADQMYARQRASREKRTAPEMKTGGSAEEQQQRLAGGIEGRPAVRGGVIAIGTPEERARVAAMVNEGSDYATADNGNQAMRAAAASESRYQGPPSIFPPNKTSMRQSQATTGQAQQNTNTKTSQATTQTAATNSNTQASQASTRAANTNSNTQVSQDSTRQAATNSNTVASQETTRQAVAKQQAAPVVAPAPAPVVSQTPAPTPQNAAKAASDKEYGQIADQRKAQGYPAIGKPSRIGATPAGMELTGMKGGVPQYTPIAEVYGAPKVASVQTSGGRITGRTMQTDEQQRAAYQRSAAPIAAQAQTPVQRAIPVKSMTTAKPVYRSSLDNPNNAFSKEAYARTAAAEQRGVQRQAELAKAVNPAGMVAVGPKRPLDELVRRGKSRMAATMAMR
jgi:hypothetical protein